MPRPVLFLIAPVVLVLAASSAWAAEEIFSGPQPGEKLAPFKVLGVYDDAAGKELDFVAQADGKPLLLVFVHDPVTRPQAAVTRALSAYAASRGKELTSGIVWLQADKSKAEEFVKNARTSLNLKSPVGVSPDGLEGPGSYGLNRGVSLTVLVAKEGKVTANFALVQPALTDGPTIIDAIVKVAGGDPIGIEAFEKLAGARYAGQDKGEKRPGAVGVQIPREILTPVIKLDATEADVARAAKAVEEYVGEDAARQKELGRIATTIVGSGKLENYGTPAAQKKLREWAKKFGSKNEGEGKQTEK